MNAPRARRMAARRLKHLIDPPYTATVKAQLRSEGPWPNGFYEVRRDGTVTHIIAGAGRGWFVHRASAAPDRKIKLRNGMSGDYATPQKAAEAFGLVVHQWGHAA